MALIIVESPTKARTFNRILKGKDYFVFATMGHFRDLPVDKIGIDYKHNFKPDYVISPAKKKTVDKLIELAKQNKEVILATDLDREGESISYHAAVVLGHIKENWPDFRQEGGTLKRIVFHEITAKALEEALANPGELRFNLVKAQQARRILDRIVGYELSPLLWKKMGKNWLSAGRVQTVALRLIVEREKEIRKFGKENYFQIYGQFGGAELNKAKLVAKDGAEYEIKNKISLFDGEYTYTKTSIDSTKATEICADLKPDKFTVSNITEETLKRFPPPPFTTSLLQQEGFRRFGFSSKMTMRLAQDLYERGLITYHRTDSFQMSSFYVFRAKDYIAKTFGEQYALEKPRGFFNKSKSAQEAHEAIRPTSLDADPDKLHGEKSTSNHKKLYELIFNRALATQMKEAEVKVVKIEITSDKGYLFRTEDQQVVFDGFLKILNPEFVKNNSTLVSLKQGAAIPLNDLESKESETQAPPRYNEASLIKTLEEKGIGRPSTYASIISLIQDKYYIEKDGRYFVPTKLGESISEYLSRTFPTIFELQFTANLEDSLDKIAEGNADFISTLAEFDKPFKAELDKSRQDTSTIDVEEKVEGKCEKCGSDLVVRFSKYGKFYGCKNYPTCTYIKPFLNVVKNRNCPQCGGEIVVRYSKNRKRFYGCAKYPQCKFSAWKLTAIKTQPAA